MTAIGPGTGMPPGRRAHQGPGELAGAGTARVDSAAARPLAGSGS